jgi:hypothetical protein
VNWGAFLSIAIWVFFVIIMLRGCGRMIGCGTGTHHHGPKTEPHETKEGNPRNRIPK